MSYAADVLSRERDQTASRLDELANEVRALRARLRELDSAIELLGGSPVRTVPAVAPSARPGERLIDRIERMLEVEGPGTSPSELAARLKEGGRETSGETVSSLLNRLKKQGTAVKRGRSWYLAPSFFVPASNEIQGGHVYAQTETEDDVAASPSVLTHT